MKKILLVLISAISTTMLASDVASMNGDDVIASYIKTQKVDSEMAFIDMTTVSVGLEVVERRFIAAYRSDGSDSGSFIRMVRPRDIEGVTVLSKNGPESSEQYLYLPAIGKARKLSGSAKSEPFLGSDFTFEDLMREAPQTQNYERIEDKTVQSKECFVIRAFEQEKGSSGYGFRDLYIAKNTYDLIQVDFYDLDGEMIKNFFAVDYRSSEVDGETTRPHKAIMVDKKTQSTTTFTVIESRVNSEIPAELFTAEKIASWEPEEVYEFVFQLGFTVVDEVE